MACATGFFSPSDNISMRLPHSASGQSLKPWNKLKILVHPNILFFRHIFVYPGFTIYETGISLDRL